MKKNHCETLCANGEFNSYRNCIKRNCKMSMFKMYRRPCKLCHHLLFIYQFLLGGGVNDEGIAVQATMLLCCHPDCEVKLHSVYIVIKDPEAHGPCSIQICECVWIKTNTGNNQLAQLYFTLLGAVCWLVMFLPILTWITGRNDGVMLKDRKATMIIIFPFFIL